MATMEIADGGDQPLVHQFIRVFGHRPTCDELERYRAALAGLSAPVHRRLRVRAARILMRL